MANKNFVDNSNITSLITKIGQNFARLKSTMTRSQYENAQNLAPGVYPIEGDENELNVISTDMISDIEVTNPSNDDVLKYNSTTQKWENGTGGSGSGGHTIQNDSGTALPQESALQFVGVYSEDDSTNGKTKVNIIREMTKAQMDALSTDAKKGVIHTTDEADNPHNPVSADEVSYGSGTVESYLNNLASNQVSYGSGTVKDALDNTQTQLASRANIKRGVNWTTAETIPLSTTIGFYSLKCGKNTAYSDLFIVYDGEWKIFGTNNASVAISGDNLIIPIYVRYLLIW